MTEERPGPERRQFLRLAASFSVSYRQLSPGQWSSGTTADVGAKGIRMVVEEPLSVGAPLAMELRLSDEVVSFVGEVVWRRRVEGGAGGWSYEIGVKFLKVSPKDRLAIMRVVERSDSDAP
jgi:c-di-GMP-binding flagellar brake protein YcgR